MEKEVCIVTGASSGLGRALARLLCEKSFRVYITARRKEELEKLKKECSKLDGEIKIISGDLTNSKFREEFVLEILKKEKRIDYLFNNAGFGKAIRFEDMNSKEIELMIELNIVAYQHLSSMVLKQMRKQGFGRLIHVGSVVAFTPLPYFTTYNSTKSAVYGFNRSLRYELKGSKISSTVVLPARMKTGFAKNAFDCSNEKSCIEEFNSIAGSPEQIAARIVKSMSLGKEVILPTFKSWLWYSTRYIAFVVDFAMKNFLGPQQEKKLPK
jgi:short-subunit dehydrogenase